MSTRREREYILCVTTQLKTYRPCPDGLASQKLFLKCTEQKNHSSLAASGAPFMLCKNYSTCGSGVQPTAPGNDIHSVVYTIPAQVTLNFVVIVTGHKNPIKIYSLKLCIYHTTYKTFQVFDWIQIFMD